MGKKTKVVIDTNVIVSAFGWHGEPENVLNLVSKGEIINFASIEMLDELRRVLSYPKLNFSETLQAEIIETIFSISSIITTENTISVIDNDLEDNKILECALTAGAEFIISGDKHLLNLKNFIGIEIATPEKFLTKKSIK